MPSSARVLVSLVMCLALLGSSAQADGQRPGNTAPSPTPPAPVDPARARAQRLYDEGVTAYGEGRLSAALQKMREAFAAFASAELAYNIGRIAERAGDADTSIEFYREYLRRNPTAPANETTDIARRIASLEALKSRQREQLRTIPPSSDALIAEARTFYDRGVQLYGRRRYRAAYLAFEAAYNHAQLPEIIYNLAVVSERLHEPARAVDWYNEYRRDARDPADRALAERRIAELRAQ